MVFWYMPSPHPMGGWCKYIFFVGVGRNLTEEQRSSFVSACNKLLNILLKDETPSLDKLSTVAYIFNVLFNAKLDVIKIEIVNAFIEKVQPIKSFKNSEDDIFNCLLNCGLYIPRCNGQVKNVLTHHLSNAEIYSCFKAKEKLLLLNDCDLSRKMLERREQILKGDFKPDFTLTFLDPFVVRALEQGASPYKPFTIRTRSFAKDRDRRKESFNPFDAKGSNVSTLLSIDKESTSPSLSLKSSVCETSSVLG